MFFTVNRFYPAGVAGIPSGAESSTCLVTTPLPARYYRDGPAASFPAALDGFGRCRG